MLPLVKIEGGEKGALGQKKPSETHETARMRGSFLFVGTAEGALYRRPRLAPAHTGAHTLQTHRQSTDVVPDLYCAAPTALD